MRITWMTVSLGLAAATFPAAAADTEAAFVATGEIVYRTSAAYDETRVRGPNVNMALTNDGRWGGTLLGKDVRLQVTADRISGAGVNLVVSRKGGEISVEGLISGIRVRVKATQDTFTGRVGDRQIECTRREGGYWSLSGGPAHVAVIRFKGTADRMPDVPMPQWIFAVIGAI